MDQYLTVKDINEMSYDLSIDVENLPDDTKSEMIVALLREVERRGHIDRLIEALEKKRPNIPWRDIWSRTSPFEKVLETGYQQWVMGGVALIAFILAGFFALNGRFAPAATPFATAPVVAEATQAPTGAAAQTAVPDATSTIVASATLPFAVDPTATNASTELPLLVEPAEAGESLILVADFDPIATDERDVSRFIVDDLSRAFEEDAYIRIAAYDKVVMSEKEAAEVAQETGAILVVWGRYDSDVVQLEMQVGPMARLYPQGLFSQDEVERVYNGRLLLSNERQQTIAPFIAMLLFALDAAQDGNIVRSMLTVQDSVELMNNSSKLLPQVEGNNTSDHIYAFTGHFFQNEYSDGLLSLDRALVQSRNAPIIIGFMGTLKVRMRLYEDAETDLRTALIVGPDGWVNPHFSLGSIALFEKRGATAIQHFTQAIEQQPDNWLHYSMRSMGHYFEGDYGSMSSDIDQSIALKPEQNWPYVMRLLVSLRDGDFLNAVSTRRFILQNFPDPFSGSRAIETFFSDAFVLTELHASVISGLVEQWPKALEHAQRGVALDPMLSEGQWMLGTTLCNVERFEEAYEAFSTAIELDESFILPYLSRATVWHELGDSEAALAELQEIPQTEQTAAFSLAIPLMEQGSLTCKNFLAFDPFG